MFRMTKNADYGVVLLTHMASDTVALPHNAKELAARSHIPLPMVTKILKILAREGLLISQRGTKGGYSLSRKPEQISMAEIIRALDGPIALTACVTGPPGDCVHESVCPVRGHVHRINLAIGHALSGIKLSELCHPPMPHDFTQLVTLDSLTVTRPPHC